MCHSRTWLQRAILGPGLPHRLEDRSGRIPSRKRTAVYVLPEKTTGPERALLEAMLDRGRRALVDNARGLSEADARRRLGPSLTTPIALVKHAAVAERRWFQWLVAGLDEAEIDGPSTPGDPSFAVGEDE